MNASSLNGMMIIDIGKLHRMTKGAWDSGFERAMEPRTATYKDFSAFWEFVTSD